MTADLGSVVVLDATDTHDLRLRVLRAGIAEPALRWPGDDDESTEHLGIVHAGAVIAISTWLTTGQSDGSTGGSVGTSVGASMGHPSGATSTQIRGMATEPALAGQGLGRRLLLAGLQRAALRDVRLVWANARIDALRFYEGSGFTAVGEPFVVPEIGIVHQRVERWLAPPSGPPQT